MITIDEATWRELLAEARAAIDRLNARCTGNYANYSHDLTVEDLGEVILATATQLNRGEYGNQTARKYLGWRKADGALLKISVKVRRTKGATRRDFSGKPVTAKSWMQAATKGPKHLLKATKLVDFFMIHVGVAPTDPPATEHEVRESIICGHHVRIERQPGESFHRISIPAWYWGTESHQTLAAAERAAREWCEKNPLEQAAS
jgi:hypothetical protein